MAGLHYPGSGALSEKSASAEASAYPQAQTPRPPCRTRAAGHGVVHLRSADRGGCADPEARSDQAALVAGEHLRLRRQQPDRALDPPRLPGADHRPIEGHLAVDEGRDRRRRGPPLLRAPRYRPARDGPRALGGHLEPWGGPGRVDDHTAVRQERLPDEQEVDRAQALRGSARLAARAAV